MLCANRQIFSRVHDETQFDLRIVLGSVSVDPSLFDRGLPFRGVFGPDMFGHGYTDHFGDVGIAVLKRLGDAAADLGDSGFLQALGFAIDDNLLVGRYVCAAITPMTMTSESARDICLRFATALLKCATSVVQ